MNLKSIIPVIPDWPKPDVNFLDITAVFESPAAFTYCSNWLVDIAKLHNATSLVAVESRGFPFAAVAANILNIPLVLARKPNKLPGATYTEFYNTEYSTDSIQIKCASAVGTTPLIVDDLLATGGTMLAVSNLLVKNFNIDKVAGAVIINLEFLSGQQILNNNNVTVYSLETYNE